MSRARNNSGTRGPATRPIVNTSNESGLVVEVRFEIKKDWEGYPKSRDAEALLCKPLDPECSVCLVASIPFYLDNVAYGDTISTRNGPSGRLDFKKVIQHGGYSNYRILLHVSAKKAEVVAKLLEFGTLVEHEGDLIAAAVPPTADLDRIVDYILVGKARDWWGAQDGFIFEGK